MKLVRMLLLATALTMPLAYAATTLTAEAAGPSKKAKPAKPAGYKAADKGADKAADKAAYKSCGTYMYRKDGECVDARAKASK
jgi:hypothetical protein